MTIKLRLARPARSSIVSSLVILASAASFIALTSTPAHAETTSVRDYTSSPNPDGRRYELVTPPRKNGALLGSLFAIHTPPMVGDEGVSVIAPSLQCFAEPESCVAYRSREGEPYEFARTGEGWVTHPLAPPVSSFDENSYWSADANTGTALFSVPSSADGPDEFLARQPGGSFVAVGPFGEQREGSAANQIHAPFVSNVGVFATADLSHVVYQTLKSVWSFDKSEGEPLYEFVGSGNAAPLMVGVEGGPESHQLVSVCNALLGGIEAPTDGEALSESGRTVYFAATGHANGECAEETAPPATWLYARVDGGLPDAHTVLISQRAAGTSGNPDEGCTTPECIENTGNEEDFRTSNFEGASDDGSRVFFTDAQQLTNGASESNGNAFGGCSHNVEVGGCNLYESVCAEPCGAAGEAPAAKERVLIDVSEGAEVGGPRVQGVMAVSADGSHVYFVAKGVLTGAEENENHETAENEEDNLYVYAEGHVTFIARLAASDQQERQWAFRIGMRANVTSDGRFLVFTDDRALTGDDTRPEGGGVDGRETAAQVFEYDAQSRVLKRVSVGEEGFNDDGNAETGNAFIVPARLGGANQGSVPDRRDPTMSENGELVFFESPIALAPGALEDASIGEGKYAENIYEYYRGQVFLVSDGKDTTPASAVPEGESHSPTSLLGVGESGANVIFTTFDALTSEDGDTQRDYYDAHLCSPAEPCIEKTGEVAPCEGEACQGAPSAPPVFAAPTSATLTGTSGNLPPPATAPPKPKTAVNKATKCKKGFVKNKRGKCIKKPEKKAKAKKSARGRKSHV